MRLAVWLMALVGVVASGSSPAHAQVVAVQGNGGPAVTELHSPMILELPFDEAAQLTEGTDLRMKGIASYVCDDVQLTRLVVRKTRSSPKRGDVYKFEGVAIVRPSHDRWVGLDFEIRIGGVSISEEGRVRFTVEESNSAMFKVDLRLTPEQTAKLAADTTSAILRLRVAVAED